MQVALILNAEYSLLLLLSVSRLEFQALNPEVERRNTTKERTAVAIQQVNIWASSFQALCILCSFVRTHGLQKKVREIDIDPELLNSFKATIK